MGVVQYLFDAGSVENTIWELYGYSDWYNNVYFDVDDIVGGPGG